MQFFGKVVLTTAAVLAMTPASAAAADALSRPDTVTASEAHVGVQLGGLRAEAHADRCGVHEDLTGRLLGLKQTLTIGCPQ